MPAPPRTGRPSRAPGALTALLVPADPDRPLMLRPVTGSAVSISDAIGGVLLDGPFHIRLPSTPLAAVYRPEERTGLPGNARLSLIATRLGLTDRAFHTTARGDALILGAPREYLDTDVPDVVLRAAARAGALVRTPSPATAPR